MKVALFRISFAFAAAASLAGCASVQAHKGSVIDSQLASSVQPGVDNKTSVEKLLGRPSFTGEFTPNDWYYVSRDTKQVAFRNPRVKQQTVLHVRFDQTGNVASVERTGQGAGNERRADQAEHSDARPQEELFRRAVRQHRDRRIRWARWRQRASLNILALPPRPALP